MPDSRDRFATQAIMQSMRDLEAASRRLREERRAAEAAVRESFMPEGFVSLGSMSTDRAREVMGLVDPFASVSTRNNYTITYASADTMPMANWVITGSGSNPNTPVETVAYPPETYWGGCGMRNCDCLGGLYYRDMNFRNIIPGTDERRGYALTVKKGRRRAIERFWQANSERRARAYQLQFYPDEKIVSVRRTKQTRRGRRIERYTPEQCHVMLPGVEFVIEEGRIY